MNEKKYIAFGFVAILFLTALSFFAQIPSAENNENNIKISLNENKENYTALLNPEKLFSEGQTLYFSNIKETEKKEFICNIKCEKSEE